MMMWRLQDVLAVAYFAKRASWLAETPRKPPTPAMVPSAGGQQLLLVVGVLQQGVHTSGPDKMVCCVQQECRCQAVVQEPGS
jgi:hypothetical protein